MITNCTIEIVCGKCRRAFTTKIQLGTIGYVRTAVKCPYCGTPHHLRIDITVKPIYITKKDLDEFEKWLIKEKQITSAKQYRRAVEKFIENPNTIPRTMSPITYFNEFMKKKGKDLTITI